METGTREEVKTEKVVKEKIKTEVLQARRASDKEALTSLQYCKAEKDKNTFGGGSDTGRQISIDVGKKPDCRE